MDGATILKIIGAIASMFAAGYVIKVVISNHQSTKTDVRFVSQKNNVAGGDIVAGDSTKSNTK